MHALRLRRLFALLSLLIGLSLTACDGMLPFIGQDLTPTADSSPVAEALTTADASLVAASTTAIPTEIPATATPTVVPTPTVDPSLPDWTILVYMAADNNLESAGLLNLNQMEAAGSSDAVNVIVQVDRSVLDDLASDEWTGTRRYRILPDEDTNQVNSELLEDLGEVNMGDPAELADFISWGMQTYPANRYGLVLWDHGIGWSGIGFDDDSSDHLLLSELQLGLRKGLDAADVRQFDMIGFDACLMGQLEVYTALAPMAGYMVGSEELTPAQGWPYEEWLRDLYADPTQDGQTVSQGVVSRFLAHYQAKGNEFVTISAVDGQKVGQVAAALDDLIVSMQGDFLFATGGIGNARGGAETYARAYGVDADTYASIDLKHFVQILEERSLEPAVIEAAQALRVTIDDAVIAAEHGRGFKQANGIAIYFPRAARFFDRSYANESPLSGWSDFLATYYASGAEDLEPPAVEILNSFSESVASIQTPAHIAFQVTGRDIEEVSIIGGLYELGADNTFTGRRLLLEYDPLIPEPTFLADGSRLFEWRDGLHEDFYVWSTRVTYLTDGENGQYVVMWPSSGEDGADTLRSVRGRLTTSAGVAFEASLVFERQSRQQVAVWGFTADGTPFEITPQFGDAFQPHQLFLDDNHEILTSAGELLQFDEQGELTFDWRPVPSGNYFLGFQAENIAGERAVVTTDLAVNNDGVTGETPRAYLDPYLGYQFLYPADWYRPVYEDQLLYTTGPQGQTFFQVTLYTDLIGVDAAELTAQTLSQFGAVDILYEDDVVITDRPGRVTAYGYSSASGERTGLFATFVRDDIGYVIDLDGAAADEGQLIETFELVTQSWEFRPVGQGLFPNNWATIDLDQFSVPQPDEFTYASSNSWQKFTALDNSQIFVALRAADADGRPLVDLVDYWATVASTGVDNYQPGLQARFLLADRVWMRQDFVYQATSGEEIWGFVMVIETGGQQFVAWAEAPALVYNQLESNVFEVMLAEIIPLP